MANSPAVTFRSLLCADSEQQLPDNDAIKALQEYGVLFKKTKIHAPERLDLLAGLVWVQAHKRTFASSAASVAQHRLLAAALRLVCDELSKTEPWLSTVVRRVLANVLPGATPEKR